MGSHDLRSYITLIDSFLEDRIDARTFERGYLSAFKKDATNWSEAEYEILNDLFGDVDAFCAEPDLPGPDDLNEVELRQRCKLALERLSALATP